MNDEESRWLTLSEASKLLGVHPATLRQWADAGQVPSYRTPGGHRRFEAGELRAYLVQASYVDTSAPAGDPHRMQASSDEALVELALGEARSELRRQPPEESTWYSAFDDAGRKRQRILGRQLFEDAVQFITRPQQRQDLLQKGHQLGEAYAESSLTYHISLLETVQAFQYFRQNLVHALAASDLGARWSGAGDARLRQETDSFLNEVLYGLIGAYERNLLEPNPV